MEGTWINIFDRKELNRDYKCYTVIFEKNDPFTDVDGNSTKPDNFYSFEYL